MVEIGRVRRHEGILGTSIIARSESDGRVGARAEIQGSALHLLGSSGSVASSLLSLALSLSAGERARVGGVGAGVVLDGAGAL